MDLYASSRTVGTYQALINEDLCTMWIALRRGKMNCIDTIFIITQYHTQQGHVGLITCVLN